MTKVSVVLQLGGEDGLQLSKDACSRLDDYFTRSRINPYGPVTLSGIPILWDLYNGRLPARDIDQEGTKVHGLYGENYENIPRNHPYLIRVVNELGISGTSKKGLLSVETIEVPEGSRSLWLVSGEGGERAYGHTPSLEERDIELDRPDTMSVLVDPAKILPIPESPEEIKIKAIKKAIAEAQALMLANETLAGLATPYNKEQAVEISKRLNKAIIFSERDSVTRMPSYFIACPTNRYVSRIPFEIKPFLFRHEAAASKVIEDFLELYVADKSTHIKDGVTIDVATQRDIDRNMDVQAYLSADRAGSSELLAAREISSFFSKGGRPAASDTATETKARNNEDGMKLRGAGG